MDSIIDFGSWLEQPAGRYIRQWEEQRFSVLTANIFGYHAVQLGLPQIRGLAANRMPFHWYSDSVAHQNEGQDQNCIALVHDMHELPFDTQSIDLVILPHVLEFADEPHQILREVERILIPEGRLIISGLNRSSLWGTRQLIGRRFGAHFLPHEGEYIRPARLKDWLKLLSLEVNQTQFGCYALPLKNEQWLQNSPLMESMGRRWWPGLGAVYMFEAIKRVRGMHLVGPVWRQQKRRRMVGLPVANRSNRDHT